MAESVQTTELWNQLRTVANACWNAVSAKVSDARNLAGVLPPFDDQAREAVLQTTRRNEAIARLLSTLLGLGLSLGVTYLGVKYIMKAMDPTHHERAASIKRAEVLMQRIGVKGVQLTEYEMCIASNLVDPLSIVSDWRNIGGLEDIIQDIQDNLILPFKHKNLFFGSALVQPPKGVLLYGPPGCGKTMIAKATAKATGARFINLQVSSLFDKWYGESQKRAEAVFSLAYKIQPTIIFIDEIDSFLRVRNSQDQETTAMVKTQFMSFWDGLLTDPNCQIMIMGATNRPTDLDAAILRRLPLMYHIKLPSERERKSIISIILSSEQLDESIDVDELAAHTNGFSGSDLRELCRSAAICRVNEFLRNETRDDSGDGDTFEEARELRPINMSDFNVALKKWRRDKLKVYTELQNIDVD